MHLHWEAVPLGPRRRPYAYGPTTAGCGPVYICGHHGPARVSWRACVRIYQPSTASRGDVRRAFRLPPFHSCDIDEPAARGCWWRNVEIVLRAWESDGHTPRGDPWRPSDTWAAIRMLSRRIPRPSSSAARERWRRGQVACRARRRAALQAAEQAAAEAAHRAEVFHTLGLSPTANLFEIKRARELKLRQLQLSGAPLDQLKQVQSAAEEATAYRLGGM